MVFCDRVNKSDNAREQYYELKKLGKCHSYHLPCGRNRLPFYPVPFICIIASIDILVNHNKTSRPIHQGLLLFYHHISSALSPKNSDTSCKKVYILSLISSRNTRNDEKDNKSTVIKANSPFVISAPSSIIKYVNTMDTTEPIEKIIPIILDTIDNGVSKAINITATNQNTIFNTKHTIDITSLKGIKSTDIIPIIHNTFRSSKAIDKRNIIFSQ